MLLYLTAGASLVAWACELANFPQKAGEAVAQRLLLCMRRTRRLFYSTTPQTAKMQPGDQGKDENFFSSEVEKKEERKIKARREDGGSVWSGLGMFGMVGWSVTVPALLGAALGIWLDKTYRQSFSWTLTFLFTGLFIGCLIAWHWVSKENKDDR